jgi:hypothetical protein
LYTDGCGQAAKNAGIYPIDVIKEPQAAALYTLYMMEERSLGVRSSDSRCSSSDDLKLL